jgi:hypothetical protein
MNEFKFYTIIFYELYKKKSLLMKQVCIEFLYKVTYLYNLYQYKSDNLNNSY